MFPLPRTQSWLIFPRSLNQFSDLISGLLLFFAPCLNGLGNALSIGAPSTPYKDFQLVLLLSAQTKLLDSVIPCLSISWEVLRFCNLLSFWYMISLLIGFLLTDSGFIILWSIRLLHIYCFPVSRFFFDISLICYN